MLSLIVHLLTKQTFSTTLNTRDTQKKYIMHTCMSYAQTTYSTISDELSMVISVFAVLMDL